MPNDLSVSVLGPAVPMTGRPNPPPIPSRPNPTAERVLPNPTLRLEAALGLVVIEFRNDRGAIETSYPSERQLAVYRANELAGIGKPGQPASLRPIAPAQAGSGSAFSPAVTLRPSPPAASQRTGSTLTA